MKLYKIKFILITLIIFNFVFLSNVLAEHYESIGGNNNSYGSCNKNICGKNENEPCEWCYSSVGLRFSLYKYVDGNLTYYGSTDYETTAGNLNGRTSLISISSAGKVAYKNGEASINWSSNYYKLSLNSGGFSKYFGTGAVSIDTLKNQIISKFQLNSNDSSTIKSKIDNFFGVDILVSELENIYITVEPTAYIYDKNGHSYYGTVYELLRIPGVTDSNKYLKGINPFLYAEFPQSIIATKPTGTDLENFISTSSSALVRWLSNYNSGWNTSGLSGDANKRKSNKDKVLSNQGYGIGVFWLGDYVTLSCSSYIAGATDKVAKAAEYCKTVEGKNNISAVKECMSSSCGISEPGGFSCNSSCPSQSSKNCPNSNENTITTCSSLNNGYMKIQCSDKQKTTPSNDLPAIFYKETGGFNYSVNVNGSKTCDLYFNNEKYYYNLKAAITTAENNSIREQRNKYVNFDFTEYMYKNDKYDMILTVQGETVSLVEIENQREIKVTTNNGYSGTTVNSIVEDNPQKRITTTISTKFEVPQACYSLKTGKVVRKNILASCGNNKLENIGYYAFYINAMNISNDYPKNYDTTLNIKKENYVSSSKTQSCTLGTNKCNFTVREDLITEKASCSISNSFLTKVGSQYQTTVYIKGNNRGNSIATCRLNNSVVSCNNGFINITLGENDSKTIQGSITYDGVTIPCNAVVATPGPTVVDPPRCTEKFSKANKNISHYADIRDYCNEKWKIDKDNYSSSTDCFNKCTQIPGVCKTTYKCDDESGIQSYCNLNWQSDGYKSVEMCVNDCSCPGDNPGTIDFIYRPIAVGGNKESGYNAFPNRNAGSNWRGYEPYTEYDKFDEKPIYVIELDENSIRNIKNDTHGDIKNYVDYDGELEDNSYYKSEFIDNYRGSIFTCVDGHGRCN